MTEASRRMMVAQSFPPGARERVADRRRVPATVRGEDHFSAEAVGFAEVAA